MLEWTGKGLYKIAVIGGICSGKSTITKYLASYRYIKIFNLDKIGHQVINDPGVTSTLEETFGKGIFLGSHENSSQFEKENYNSGKRIIDRSSMGKIVFQDRQKLDKLNQIMWPKIAKLQNIGLAQLEQSGYASIAAIEGAVILEANFLQYYHELWCATLPKEIAIQRLLTRNPELSPQDAERRVKAQMGDEERIKFMEERNLKDKFFTIDTSKEIEVNRRLIDERLKTYKESNILKSLDRMKL